MEKNILYNLDLLYISHHRTSFLKNVYAIHARKDSKMILNNQGKCIEWFKFYKKSIQVLDNLRNIFSMMTKSIELL